MSDTIPITGPEIERELLQLGLQRGCALEVHSSLSSFGHVEGGAAAVVDALINVVGEQGALVMSAYPVSKPLPLNEAEKSRGILARVRIYAEDYQGPTGMGAIADEFRSRPGTILGTGIHRVCAWGADAEKHSQGYQYLLAVDGWVLLVGVGIHRCSSMHQAEKEGIPHQISDYFKVPDDIRRDYPDDIYISYGSTPEDAWEKVRAIAEQRGLIRRRRIGLAECMLFKAKPVINIYEQALRSDPFGLFGVKSARCSS